MIRETHFFTLFLDCDSIELTYSTQNFLLFVKTIERLLAENTPLGLFFSCSLAFKIDKK